jgi:outer membrane protein assembly factor BamA
MKLAAALMAVTAMANSVPPKSGPVSGNAAPPVNVNSRYTVESVELTRDSGRVSGRLRDRMNALVGTRFDQEVFDTLTATIRRELDNHRVSMRVARGSQPEHVRVVFEVPQGDKVEVVVPRLVYHSKQNFTFGADMNVRSRDFVISAGLLTDNDELSERYSGIRAGFARENLAGGHLRLEVRAESFRDQWNGATTRALAASADQPGIYRSRVGFAPSATILFTRDLTLQLGVSMQRVETQYPSTRHELSSAAVSTLRFQRRWEASNATRHALGASWTLRASTRMLGGDFVYGRQAVDANYEFTSGRDTVMATFQAGLLNGRAPLFERFMLGNSRTLRGWNKFDVAPFGGDRMAHGSVEFRHGMLRAVYDTGAVWQGAGDPRVRHSAAVGITKGSVMAVTFLVAFPLREGRVEPIFITGINF